MMSQYKNDFNSQSEEHILSQVFERLEQKFQNNFEKLCSEQKQLWRKNTFDDIFNGLFHSFLDRSYRMFFRKDKFNNSISVAENLALDEVFLNIIEQDDTFNYDDESPHKFEEMLKQRFQKEWKNKAKLQCKEDGFEHELQSFFNQALEKKFLKFELTLRD